MPPRRALLLALASLAALPPAADAQDAASAALLSPASDAATERRQLEELRFWMLNTKCLGKRCDTIGCHCDNAASDYAAPSSDGPVSWLVVFCAPWADRCTKFEKLVRDVAPDLQGLYKIGYINAEKEELFAHEQYGVHVFPTLLAFPHGFGGGHEPFEYDRAKASPGKVASWALGLLPNRVMQVSNSDDLFRATSSKQVAVLLFNDKRGTPAGFKAAALRHAHPLARANAKHLHFTEIRRHRYAQTANGEDGTDLGELVRKIGPGMDQRQWPQIVVISTKKSTSNAKFVVWRNKHYSIERFMVTDIGTKLKANKFYSTQLELALGKVLDGIAGGGIARLGGGALDAAAAAAVTGYSLPAPGDVKKPPPPPAEPPRPPSGKVPCSDEGPWECFASGCPKNVLTCSDLAYVQKACAQPFNIKTMRGKGISDGRMIRDACKLSCGSCRPGEFVLAPGPPPQRTPADTKLPSGHAAGSPAAAQEAQRKADKANQEAQRKADKAKQTAEQVRLAELAKQTSQNRLNRNKATVPPSTAGRTSTEPANGFVLKGSPVKGLSDGVFTPDGEYGGQQLYRFLSGQQAPGSNGHVMANLAALYWHAADRTWTFHSTFDEAAAAHGLGHARFKAPAVTDVIYGKVQAKLPLGTQEWTCWMVGVGPNNPSGLGQWQRCILTLMSVDAAETAKPAMTAGERIKQEQEQTAAQQARKVGEENFLKEQKAANAAAEKRKAGNEAAHRMAEDAMKRKQIEQAAEAARGAQAAEAERVQAEAARQALAAQLAEKMRLDELARQTAENRIKRNKATVPPPTAEQQRAKFQGKFTSNLRLPVIARPLLTDCLWRQR